jgi:hypothetical protein
MTTADIIAQMKSVFAKCKKGKCDIYTTTFGFSGFKGQTKENAPAKLKNELLKTASEDLNKLEQDKDTDKDIELSLNDKFAAVSKGKNYFTYAKTSDSQTVCQCKLGMQTMATCFKIYNKE